MPIIIIIIIIIMIIILKISNLRETQMADLSVLIGRYSIHFKHLETFYEYSLFFIQVHK